MKFTKTLEPSDYENIQLEVQELKEAHQHFIERDIRIDLGHPHRFWEYGMAIKAFVKWAEIPGNSISKVSIVDVGAGLGLLGPTLAWCTGEFNVTEVEPNVECYSHRTVLNNWLHQEGKPQIRLTKEIKETDKFDIVFCISVIEHVPDDHNFLRCLAELVKENGLLFMTTDIVPKMLGNYMYDNLREHNFTVADLYSKTHYLGSKGFEFLDKNDNPNFDYNGDQVFNYTFGAIAMVKTI